MGVAGFGEQPCAAEVDGEHVVPVLDGQVAYRTGVGDSSIGYQRVQATEFGYRRFYQSTWHVGIAEVAHQRDGSTAHLLNGTNDLLLAGVQLVSTHRDHRLRAPSESGLCDPQAGGCADAATSSTDQSPHRTYSCDRDSRGDFPSFQPLSVRSSIALSTSYKVFCSRMTSRTTLLTPNVASTASPSATKSMTPVPIGS